jgi:hypothetical protein
VGGGMFAGEMSRHTTFRFCLDPTVGQLDVLARHAGAARFAFNQCLGMVKTALDQRKADPPTARKSPASPMHPKRWPPE